MFTNYSFDKTDPSQCHAFEIHGIDLSIVNGIRRVILTDVDVVGLSGEDEPSVEVLTNTGRLHNEIIMHRIGLLPFHISELETDAFQEGQYTIELDKNNKGDLMTNVTTHDIRVYKDGSLLSEKETHTIFPVDMVSNQPILITRLRPKEHLHVRGDVVKRTARFHAGFSPVSHCTFFFLPDHVVAATKTNVLDKERAFLRNEYGDPVAFKFEIEPKVKLMPKYLVHKSLEIITSKLTTLQEEIHNEASTKVKVEAGDTGGINFTIADEDDTVGNIIQSHVHVNFVRKDLQVSYIGYYCPHPLDYTVVLNMRLKDESATKDKYVEFMSSVLSSLTSHLQDISNSWLQFCAKK